jgi:hypothetical protein
MTSLKLTPAEIRLLDIQEAHGIPYPDDIIAWQKAHAAELAALERELCEAEAEAYASRW